MKIIQFMPEFGLAGAEIMCENLTNSLVKRGHEVLVVSLYTYHSVITDRMEKSGIKVIYLDKKPGIDFSLFKKIRNVIINEMPIGVIHTHRYLLKYVKAACWGMDIKVVHTLHSVAKKENNKLDRTLNSFYFHQKKVKPVALSEEVKNTIIEEYKLNINDVPVVYNGVPLNRCIPKEDYLIEKSFNIIHVGRLCPVKNHISLINSIVSLHSKYPQVLLHLYGDGELKQNVLDQINNSNASEYIIYHGLTDNPYPLLHNADLFILPSLYEGMPMTIIEAMGTALPIVASRVGGIPDMIEDKKEGLLCTPDSDDIERCIALMINDDNLRARLGRAALTSAYKFSSEKMAEEYEKIYLSLQ